MSIEAMKQALKFCEEIGDLRGPYPFVNETQIVSDSREVLKALRQAIAEAEKQEPVLFFIQYKHRHEILWSKPKWVQDGVLEIKPFYAAPVYASDISQERFDETAKDRHKTDCKKDFDLLFEANSADIEALQDAQFTLEAIKSADPGTHDEIIDASLHLIKLALSNSVFGPIERIAERYGVEI